MTLCAQAVYRHDIVYLMWQRRGCVVRSGGVLKGGGSARGPEGRGAGGSSATFEGGRRRQRDSGER